MRRDVAKDESLVSAIRTCRICERHAAKANAELKQRTPFIFVSENPVLLVISEGPPEKAWNDDIGKQWANGDLWGDDPKAPEVLRLSLGLTRQELEQKVIWIQRRNCWLGGANDQLTKMCSEEYLGRIIQFYSPKIILILGGIAAERFFRFKKLSDIVDGRPRNIANAEADVYVLYHPSWRNGHRYSEEWYNRISREIGAKIKKL